MDGRQERLGSSGMETTREKRNENGEGAATRLRKIVRMAKFLDRKIVYEITRRLVMGIMSRTRRVHGGEHCVGRGVKCKRGNQSAKTTVVFSNSNTRGWEKRRGKKHMAENWMVGGLSYL